jgi:predicted HTH transcriptional regulator
MITESIIRKSIQGIITNRLKAELVVQKVTEGLLAPQQKKIYKHIPRDEYLSTKEIAAKARLESNTVSSQLFQMKKYTTLLRMKRQGRIVFWKRK